MKNLQDVFSPLSWKSSERMHSLYLVGLLLSAASLPLSRAGLSMGIGWIFLVWVFSGEYKAKWERLIQFPWAIGWMVFFIWHIVGISYTNDFSGVKAELIVKLPFFILPLVIASNKVATKDEIRLIVQTFIAACFVGTLICYGNAFIRTFQEGYNPHYFTHHAFTRILDMHAIYFAMFLNFSVFGLVWLWQTRTNQKASLWPYFLLGFYLMSVMTTLSARMQVLSFAFIAISWLIYWGWTEKKPLSALLIAGGMAVILMGLISLNPINQARFKEATDLKSDYTENTWGGRSLRLNMWSFAGEIILDNPLLGVGTGASKSQLIAAFEANNFAIGYENQFDVHNQYLETTLTLGIPGGLFLIFLLGTALIYALRNRKGLLLAFLLLLCLSCLTESMLNRQWGASFLCMFGVLLWREE